MILVLSKLLEAEASHECQYKANLDIDKFQDWLALSTMLALHHLSPLSSVNPVVSKTRNIMEYPGMMCMYDGNSRKQKEVSRSEPLFPSLT